jgi:hypothetical protein
VGAVAEVKFWKQAKIVFFDQNQFSVKKIVAQNRLPIAVLLS